MFERCHASGGSRTDTSELFHRYRRSGDRSARDRLVLAHRDLAERCARRFRGRGEQLADLVQVAHLGLIKAVERFDPERNVPFASFATPTITGELKRHFRDATWTVSVPRRAKDLRSSVHRASDELGQRHGRSPGVEEIATATELDPAEVEETLAANRAYRPVPLDQPRPGADGDDHGPVVAIDLHGGHAPSTDAADQRVDVVRMINGLQERDRKIVVWRFYEECTQREIGERLGIGQVQVSRLLRSALVSLHQRAGVPRADSPA
jgi:RNA polymerase sigma-B factor